MTEADLIPGPINPANSRFESLGAKLRELLSYDCITGIFTWNVARGGRAHAGSRAGCLHGNGYRTIRYNGKHIYEHTLAWFFVTGEWVKRLDHKDGDGLNNTFGNLRKATASQNGYNTRKRIDNTSGFKGVYWDSYYSIWRAVIWQEGKRILIGSFKTKEAAAEAYKIGAEKVAGEFIRYE